jgi:hypothetical protein
LCCCWPTGEQVAPQNTIESHIALIAPF